MHNALKFGRPVHWQQSLSSFSLSNANRSNSITLTPPPSLIRFVQTAASDEMDSNKQSEKTETQKQKEPTQDTMSCFGEGYATRSDEEGFGGIYGGNQYLNKNDDDKNGQEFDHNQGSHVKEKETSRNQKAE